MGLNITGAAVGTTNLNLKTGSVTKSLPVTVESRNLLAYGPVATAVNGIATTVEADGSLHVKSDSLMAGSGVKWPLGEIPAGTYQVTAHGDNPDTVFPWTGIYLAIVDADGKRLCYINVQQRPPQTLTLSKATSLWLVVCGAISSSGKSYDQTLHPALYVSDDVPTAWEKPNGTSVEGEGGEMMP